jgi:diguanylate cyclase (GGDEF)-like protein
MLKDTAKPRVLVVDDQAVVLDALRCALRRDYTVVTCSSGHEALTVLHSQPPFAVIVSDMSMPGMDGAAFLRQARRHHPETSRVLLTGQTNVRAAVDAVNEGGIHHFLTKPCDPLELRAHLAEAAREYDSRHDRRQALLAADRRRREAEHAHRTLEGRLHALLQDVPSPLVLVAPDGQVLECSAATRALLGGVVEVGAPFPFELVHEDDRDRLMRLCAGNGGRVAGRTLTFRLSHSRGWRAMTATPSGGADGAVVMRDAATATEHSAELRRSFHHDPVTNLPNRAVLEERLGHLLGERVGSIAVLVVDLDDFGGVNTLYGHREGDELLAAIAGRLSGVLRERDMLARYSGDEFIALCGGIRGVDDAIEVARRVTAELATPLPLQDSVRTHVRISASIGVALPRPDQRPSDVIGDAEAAMRHAKARQRGSVSVFAPAMREIAASRHQIAQDLADAVVHEQLAVAYQPIFDVRSGAVRGVEALLRWSRRGHGPVSPSSFVPLAEETGLIVPLGRWVLARAIEDVMGLPLPAGAAAPHLAVNLSARQLADPELVVAVDATLRRFGMDPSRLELEVTETAVLADADVTAATLQQLRRLGVRLSLDDFGTGYSSLLHLRRHPFDLLKVDRSFIARADSDSRDRAIVAGVTALARSLGLDVVAEGIETRAQLAAVRAARCAYAQGYLLARPMPIGEVAALLCGARPAVAAGAAQR